MGIKQWLSENVNTLIAAILHFLLDPIIIEFYKEVWKAITLNPTNTLEALQGYGSLAAIAVVGIFTGFSIQEQKNKKAKKETSIDVFSRDELKVSKFLKRAKKEIHIVAITLEETTRASNTLEEMLKKPEITKIRVLICDPLSPIKNEIERLVAADINTISSSLNTLKGLRKQYGKLDVRIYDEIPVQSMFILDPNLKSGIMQFEPYVFGITKGRRKIQELKGKRKQKALFDIYYESYENMWKLGKSPQWDDI